MSIIRLVVHPLFTMTGVEDLERLADEADRNKYTETDDYLDLRAVIDKAHQCIKVVHHAYSCSNYLFVNIFSFYYPTAYPTIFTTYLVSCEPV